MAEGGKEEEVVNWGASNGAVESELDYSPRVSSASSGKNSTPGIVVVGGDVISRGIAGS